MKTYVISLLFSIALIVTAYAQDAGPKTKEQWTAFIKQDAKLSTLQALLGAPDLRKSSNDLDGPRERCEWVGKFEGGTKYPGRLKILASPYKGEMIIWAIFDPVTEDSVIFPWADKVRRGF